MAHPAMGEQPAPPATPGELGTLPPHHVGRHIPALDGIRGLAAALVMFWHFGRVAPAGSGMGGAVVAGVTQFGWAGVDLFFVLSGFLITGILVDTRDRPDFFRTFYKRRTLRIFPLYFAFIALYLYVIIPLLGGESTDLYPRQRWVWTYLVNFDIALHGWFSGVGSHANNLWSLAIEEQFYLVLPMLVFLLPRRKLWWVASACVVGALVARVAIAYLGYPTRVAYVLTFTRVDGLGLGVLLALLARNGDVFRRLVPIARVTLVTALAVVIVDCLRADRFSMDDWSTLLVAEPALTIGFAAMLLLTVADNGSAVCRTLFESRTLRFLGLYSYGLYIWHPLMGRLVSRAGVTQPAMTDLLGSAFAAFLLVVAVKVIAATLAAVTSYYVIERPFLLLKDRPLWRRNKVGVAAP